MGRDTSFPNFDGRMGRETKSPAVMPMDSIYRSVKAKMERNTTNIANSESESQEKQNLQVVQ